MLSVSVREKPSRWVAETCEVPSCPNAMDGYQ